MEGSMTVNTLPWSNAAVNYVENFSRGNFKIPHRFIKNLPFSVGFFSNELDY